MSLRLGIDVDGVTADFHGWFFQLYNLWFDAELTVEHLQDWHGLRRLTHFATNDEMYDWFGAARGWATMPFVPGALGAITELARKHHIQFITARHQSAAAQTNEWKQRSPFYATRLTIDCQRKSIIPCSLYVDDSPSVVKELVSADKQVIVFDRPWNRRLPKAVEAKVRRASNWAEVLELVEEY